MLDQGAEAQTLYNVYLPFYNDLVQIVSTSVLGTLNGLLFENKVHTNFFFGASYMYIM